MNLHGTAAPAKACAPTLEMVAMADMALAEVGIGKLIYIVNGSFGWPFGVTAEERAACRKAALLVRLRVEGPDRLVKCDEHLDPHAPCGFVTVGDALVGRCCHLLAKET